MIVFSNLTKTETIDTINFSEYNKLLYVIISDIPYTSLRNILINKAKTNFIKLDKMYVVIGKKPDSISNSFLVECAKTFYGCDNVDAY